MKRIPWMKIKNGSRSLSSRNGLRFSIRFSVLFTKYCGNIWALIVVYSLLFGRLSSDIYARSSNNDAYRRAMAARSTLLPPACPRSSLVAVRSLSLQSSILNRQS